MLVLPGMSTSIPGTVVEQVQSSNESAFNFDYVTVRLYRRLDAVDLNEDAVEVRGDWFAIGGDLMNGPAPGAKGTRTTVTRVTLPSGAILNVGRAGPGFGQSGDVAEYVSGPTASSG